MSSGATDAEEDWVASTERDPSTLRLIALGDHFSRVHAGGSSIPKIHNGQWSLGARTLLKEANLVAVRTAQPLSRVTSVAHPESTQSGVALESLMVGPCDFFGSLPHSWKFEHRFDIDQDGVPCVFRRPKRPAVHPSPPKFPVSPQMVARFSYDWVSGKRPDHRGKIAALQQQLGDNFPDSSLFPDMGVLRVHERAVKLPDPTVQMHEAGVPLDSLDLSSFHAELVCNQGPFEVRTDRGWDETLDVVTYWYGPRYNEDYSLKHDGLFLEVHDFTQTMTPLHPEAGGFVMLARPVEQPDQTEQPISPAASGCSCCRAGASSGPGYYKPSGEGVFEVIGVKIPFGMTLLVHQGAIHGDTTLRGMYMMLMSSDHNLMSTADAVFLRSAEDESQTVRVDMEGDGEPEIIGHKLSKRLRPLMPGISIADEYVSKVAVRA